MADPTWYDKKRVAEKGSVILSQWRADREAARALTTQAPAPERQAAPRGRVRSYNAAQGSRLTASFLATNTSIDADLLMGLDALRGRSRNVCQNNAYGAKFLRMVQTNVVGATGFTLQAMAQDVKISGNTVTRIDDGLANDALESAFSEWSARGVCDITGQLSFRDLCRLVARTVAQDGEALVRRIRNKKANRFGYALQLVDVDRLLVNDNRRLDNGNVVRMGVEITPLGRPAAYWLRTTHPGDSLVTRVGDVIVERVDAADIFHIFIPLRPEQRRGAPWLAPVLESIWHLGEFDQSALVAARKGADTLGFFVSPDGAPPPIGDDEQDGAPIEVSVAGTFDTLPEGYDVRNFDSKYPNEVYDSYVKACLRRISSGANVAYHGLGNDLEGVNFSSIRAGTLEERDSWMELQDWMIDALLVPIYRDWLEMSLLTGAITMPNGSALPAAKFNKFFSHGWQGRRWAWVDPVKDWDAIRLAIKTGAGSPQMACAQQGVDFDKVIADLKAFEQRIKAEGITLINLEEQSKPIPVSQEPTS
jgi:lambda family phage portal protein